MKKQFCRYGSLDFRQDLRKSLEQALARCLTLTRRYTSSKIYIPILIIQFYLELSSEPGPQNFSL